MTRTDSPDGLVAETLAISGAHGDKIHAYWARPTGPGPHPGIVLFHHRPGWDEFTKEAARRFAHHGYSALTPDLYCRNGHGAPDDVAARVRANGDVSDIQVVGDGIASIDFLKSQPTLNGKVAVFGTCSGARHAYLTACNTDLADAVIDCWGGRIVMAEEELSSTYPVAPIDLTENLTCPVLGLFGEADRAPSPEEVALHAVRLQEHDKEYEFHSYPDAGHGFFYYDRPASYRAAQAIDGWEKIWDFLRRHLD